MESTRKTETTPKATEPDDQESPLSGKAFLDANRKNRAKAKVRAEQEAQRKTARTPGKVPTPRRSLLGATEHGDGKRLVIALVAACTILAGTTAGFAIWGIGKSQVAAQTDPQSAHGQDAMNTARSYVASVMTYNVKDYADLDRRIRDVSTTDFAEKFIESSAVARKGNGAAGASSKAVAAKAGVVSLSAERAQVLVTLDQTITAPEIAAELPDGHLYQSRVQVTLVRDGDRWLLDDLLVV